MRRCWTAEDAGWDGDALEAEGFAYLAVRSKRGLPLSLPTTTGVKQPMTGGKSRETGRLTGDFLREAGALA